MFTTALPRSGLLPAVCMIATLLLAGCGRGQNPQDGQFPPPSVSVAEVVARDITPWDEFNGRIEAIETVQVRPRVGGVIEQVLYTEGDLVKKGDVLFVLDQRPFRAELERAAAELARARAQAALALAESERARNLFERQLISRNELDQRTAAETQANANVQAMEAAVSLARLDMEYTEVRAPIDGRAGRALFTRGNLVASDPTPDTLTTLVSIDPIYVYFDCDELTYLRYARVTREMSAAGDKQQGTTVFIGLANEQDFPRRGRLDFVDNQLDPATGTIRLRAVLENGDRELRPGLFARVRLLASRPMPAVLIDDRAVLTDQDRKYVYALGPENQAMRRDIQIGRTIDNLRIVTDGLQQGDRIIVHGAQKVFFPGMPVVPQTIAMGDPPPVPGPSSGGGH